MFLKWNKSAHHEKKMPRTPVPPSFLSVLLSGSPFLRVESITCANNLCIKLAKTWQKTFDQPNFCAAFGKIDPQSSKLEGKFALFRISGCIQSTGNLEQVFS